MERTLISDLREKIGKESTIMGHVGRMRDHGKVLFVDLMDRTGSVQCVSTESSDPFKIIKSLGRESVVSFKGIPKERPNNSVSESKNGDIEFSIQDIEIISHAEELPFDMDGELNIDTLLDYRPLTLRIDKIKSLFSLQSKILKGYREYLDKNSFVEINVPRIVGEDGEGGADVFKIDYFGQNAYLATSPQLYKQIFMGVYERVYTIGNVSRAERHSTSRHLNEYTSLDAEMGFIKDHTDVMEMLEGVMRNIIEFVNDNASDELSVLEAEKVLLPSESFPTMKLSEVHEILHKDQKDLDPKAKLDLSPEEEREISKYAKEKFNSDFLFVTHYPVAKRPVYAYEDEEDPGFTKSFDLLLRGIELCSGGQRIHSYSKLVESMKKKKLNVENFSFYLQAFKYGIPSHGGWGIGLERLTAKIAGIKNIKEASPFPREINRIDKKLYE